MILHKIPHSRWPQRRNQAAEPAAWQVANERSRSPRAARSPQRKSDSRGDRKGARKVRRRSRRERHHKRNGFLTSLRLHRKCHWSIFTFYPDFSWAIHTRSTSVYSFSRLSFGRSIYTMAIKQWQWQHRFVLSPIATRKRDRNSEVIHWIIAWKWHNWTPHCSCYHIVGWFQNIKSWPSTSSVYLLR